jgi:hypothetical protein
MLPGNKILPRKYYPENIAPKTLPRKHYLEKLPRKHYPENIAPKSITQKYRVAEKDI